MAKRKAPANPPLPVPSSAIPPTLPPSVEEAYRRKCIELKQRTKEVDAVNDATKLRISRLRRQLEKVRIERAFLLEQLAKRTSLNVEDSDGSPSPPPASPPLLQPQEKPLRIKRDLKDGHHKELPSGRSTVPTANGISFSFSSTNPPKKPLSAFEIYASATREDLIKSKTSDSPDDEATLAAAIASAEEELSQAWKDLTDEEKETYQNRERMELDKYKRDLEEYDAAQQEQQQQEQQQQEQAQQEQAQQPKAKRAKTTSKSGASSSDKTMELDHEAPDAGDANTDVDPEAARPSPPTDVGSETAAVTAKADTPASVSKPDSAKEDSNKDKDTDVDVDAATDVDVDMDVATSKPASQDGDVEMTNYDSDQGTELGNES